MTYCQFLSSGCLSLLLLSGCSQKLTASQAHDVYMEGVNTWKGEGVPKNADKAVKLFREAAEAGDVEAQVALGYAYEKGKGITQDLKEGVKWFKLAAEQGSIDAVYNIGIAYVRGQGVPLDQREAARWFAKAALQGDVGAAYNLGLMNYNGEGVKENPTLAYAWFVSAAEAGHADAQVQVAALEKAFTAEDRKKAHDLALQLKEQIVKPTPLEEINQGAAL